MNNLVFVIFAGLSTFLWAGFVFHSSGGNDLLIDKYSGSYAGLLTILTLLWLGSLLWAWKKRASLGSTLGSAVRSALPTLILAGLILPTAWIYLHHRNLQKDVFTPLGEEAHAFWQIDKTGPIPDANGLRVLTIGGSTTWCSKLERDQAWPSLLQERLRKQFPDTEIDVLNAGVPWHTSMHSLLRYVGRFSDWQPHVVIVMHAFNDMYQTSEGRLTSGSYRDDYGHFFGALGARVNPRDRLGDTVKSLWNNNWLARTWYSDFSDSAEQAAKAKVDLLRTLPQFERNLSELARRVQADGAKVVIMTQPHIYTDNMPQAVRDSLFYPFYYQDYATVPSVASQHAALESYNNTTRALGSTSTDYLIDLEAAIPKTAAMMFDDVHYTVEGAQRVAEHVHSALPWDEFVSQAGAVRP